MQRESNSDNPQHPSLIESIEALHGADAIDATNTIDAEDVIEVDHVDHGPWSLLLSTLAGVLGVLLYWSFGARTGLGYTLSFLSFGVMMYVILWNTGRTNRDDSETISE